MWTKTDPFSQVVLLSTRYIVSLEYKKISEPSFGMSFGMSQGSRLCFQFWCGFWVPAGGSSHREWSKEAHTRHVALCQQAQEPLLLALGPGHHLQEED